MWRRSSHLIDARKARVRTPPEIKHAGCFGSLVAQDRIGQEQVLLFLTVRSGVKRFQRVYLACKEELSCMLLGSCRNLSHRSRRATSSIPCTSHPLL